VTNEMEPSIEFQTSDHHGAASSADPCSTQRGASCRSKKLCRNTQNLSTKQNRDGGKPRPQTRIRRKPGKGETAHDARQVEKNGKKKKPISPDDCPARKHRSVESHKDAI